MNTHHAVLARDFAKHFPDFDPYEVLLKPSPSRLRLFHARMGRLEHEANSEYYAPRRKEADRLWREHEAAARAQPDFDEDLWEIEVAAAMEEARVKNPLEFLGYTPTDRRLDEQHNELRLLRHTVRQFMAGKEADSLPPFRPVQRPGMPIRSHEEDDDSFLDLDDDAALAAAGYGPPE